MKSAHAFVVVLVTAPDLKTARRLVRLALEQRLVACGNLVPKLESHYWWRGKIEASAEVLILFKTRHALLRRLEALVLQNHPYDTPEIVALPLSSSSPKYLQWLGASTTGS